jgi:succinate-semialdehyde dehydrogenase/glutarate-semialdehyde dehydrogenase
MKYESVDPATGRPVERFATATNPELDQAIAAAASAFIAWRERPLAVRTGFLSRIADLLEERAAELAGVMATEMGKPVAEGRAEAGKCAWVCRYYAEHAAAFLAQVHKESDGAGAWVRHDPLGPILAIMPWNFPFWQFFRFAAPALAAGNVTLLKHSPNTPRCARRIEQLVLQAGLPEGVVRNLFLTDDQAATAIADPRVRGVTFTGSTAGGKQVAAVAGAHMKPIVLELGGSDPFIVFDDADLDRALETAVTSRCLNNGQSCIAAKRFLVQGSVFDDFRDGLVERMRSLVMGDPSEPGVQLGPLARRDLRDRLAEQVTRSIAAGAQALCGGTVPDRDGFYYPATVLVDAPPGSPAATEELFGPVATLFSFETEDDAVAGANATGYGLGAGVWTADRNRAERMIRDIESGAVFVNGLVKSDPRLPFGGVKDSGHGRELGREGMLEFVNRKTVWMGP